MKRIKIISAVLLIAVVCLSLCSCAQLDDLRDRQGFFNQDGIIYKDKLYKSVDFAENLNFDYLHQTDIKVTDSDVPVLASVIIGFDYSINDDETVISGGYDSEWYVREDMYSVYEQGIKNGVEYTEIGFEYFDFDLGEQVEYTLNEQECELLESILKTEPINEEFEVYEELYLYTQSADGLFRRDLYYSVMHSDNGYYVRLYDDGAENAVYKSNGLTDKMFEGFFNKGYDVPDYNF